MTEKIHTQGQFEKELRKTIIHLACTIDGDVLYNHKLRTSFKNIMTRLFLNKHYQNIVVLNRKDIRDLLVDKIWEEFYDIAKRKDIETAICIIFRRYEKTK